jgi:hypothetical protein
MKCSKNAVSRQQLSISPDSFQDIHNSLGLESYIGSGFKTRHVRHHAKQLQWSLSVVDSVCVTDTHTEQTIRGGKHLGY